MTQDGEVCRGAHPRGGGRAPPAPGPRASSFARGFLAILVALAMMLGLRDARADHFEVNDANWLGCSEMLEIARSELGAARVRPVAVLDWSEVQPEDGVLAIHPLQPMDPDDTTSFMKAGGRLAVLIDEDGAGEETLARFHIYRVPPPSRPVAALRNRAAFAIAEPVIDVVAGHMTGAHPVVQHVQQLVTNHPAGLRHPALSPVLRIRAIGEPDAILAVAGQVGKGRLFAMGDSSAIINQMLRYPGNRAFVTGLVHYLVDDDGAMRRQGRLFIVTNRFGEEGSFGGQGSTQKELASHLKALAAALADARRDGFPGWAHLAAAALAALGLALWVARASARPYRSPLPRYARPVPLVAQGGVAGRFAVLAAPSSPRSLALLELKSALHEGLAARLAFGAEPAPEALAKMALKAGSLDGSTYSALKEILAMMHQVETAVVAGRPVRVTVRELSRAADVVHDVLRAVNEGAHKPLPDRAPPSTTPPHAGDSAG